jgi:hypothetical protein
MSAASKHDEHSNNNNILSFTTFLFLFKVFSHKNNKYLPRTFLGQILGKIVIKNSNLIFRFYLIRILNYKSLFVFLFFYPKSLSLKTKELALKKIYLNTTNYNLLSIKWIINQKDLGLGNKAQRFGHQV